MQISCCNQKWVSAEPTNLTDRQSTNQPAKPCLWLEAAAEWPVLVVASFAIFDCRPQAMLLGCWVPQLQQLHMAAVAKPVPKCNKCLWGEKYMYVRTRKVKSHFFVLTGGCYCCCYFCSRYLYACGWFFFVWILLNFCGQQTRQTDRATGGSRQFEPQLSWRKQKYEKKKQNKSKTYCGEIAKNHKDCMRWRHLQQSPSAVCGTATFHICQQYL